MLHEKEIEEILGMALSRGGDFSEIFMEDTRATAISCEGGRLEKSISGIDRGAGIRVISGEQTVYAYGNACDAKTLCELAESLSQSFQHASKKTPCVTLKPQHVFDFKPKREVSLDEKIAAVERADKVARKAGEFVKQVMVRYGDSDQTVWIANSEGLWVQDRRFRTRLIVQVIAAKEGLLQTGFEGPAGMCGFELLEKYSPEWIAEEAARRALLMLDSEPAPAGKMMVVLSGEAGGTMVHEACGHSLESDHIRRAGSVFSGKVGKRVASELITVVDDATLPGHFGTFSVDDEGTKAERTVLIERGVLQGYLSDKLSARLMGIPESGNGRRETFRSRPGPRMTNTFIAAGTMDPDEIIQSVPKGLLVKRMGGGQVDVVNGDFVFEVMEANLIENGKVGKPVRGAMLTGNGPRVLETIDKVGNDLQFIPGVCGKGDHAPVSDGQPTLRIPEITVGGG